MFFVLICLIGKSDRKKFKNKNIARHVITRYAGRRDKSRKEESELDNVLVDQQNTVQQTQPRRLINAASSPPVQSAPEGEDEKQDTMDKVRKLPGEMCSNSTGILRKTMFL